MKIIKVSGATPLQLNYLVAKCQNLDFAISEPQRNGKRYILLFYYSNEDGCVDGRIYCPSTLWGDSGPIIENCGIGISLTSKGWVAMHVNPHVKLMHGPTPLIAAMRCYVVSKFGERVEIPEELI